jgi:hypothetical protein
MVKKLIVIPFIVFVGGCASQITPASKAAIANDNSNDDVVTQSACEGNTQLPAELIGKFDAVTDPELLARAIGEPEKGGLCEGQVYVAKAGETSVVYRSWNSRNDYTKFGSWWAPTLPLGSERTYREDFNICYTWSPLDKLVKCELKAGTKVVVGPGQSAICPPINEYPKTYIIPPSAKKQVYIENAQETTTNCVVFNSEFNWTPVKEE